MEVELGGCVIEVISEARCSWSWKAESRSPRGVGGCGGEREMVDVPGRMRREGGGGFVGELVDEVRPVGALV